MLHGPKIVQVTDFDCRGGSDNGLCDHRLEFLVNGFEMRFQVFVGRFDKGLVVCHPLGSKSRFAPAST